MGDARKEGLVAAISHVKAIIAAAKNAGKEIAVEKKLKVEGKERL